MNTNEPKSSPSALFSWYHKPERMKSCQPEVDTKGRCLEGSADDPAACAYCLRRVRSPGGWNSLDRVVQGSGAV